MADTIRIKPHHFVDIIADLADEAAEFAPSPYGHAYHSIAARLVANGDARLEMDLGADDICAPCIHNADGRCDDVIDNSWRPEAPQSKGEYNLMLDERWCALLGIGPGARLTAREMAAMIIPAADQAGTVYRELPAERVAAKAESIRRGARRFLDRRAGARGNGGAQS